MVTGWPNRRRQCDASTVRVRLSPGQQDDDERGLRLLVTDPAGAPVLTAGSVVMRAADPGQLRSAPRPGTDGLLVVDWVPLDVPADLPDTAGWVALGRDLELPNFLESRRTEIDGKLPVLEQAVP